MRRIAIGIYVESAPFRLRTTLDSVRSHTGHPVALLLLPDAPDAEMARFLATVNLPQAATTRPLGAAACFNRLTQTTEADVFIFLESGAQVAPGWLDHLLQALDADPHNGLAGPSTNFSWNEQGVCPRAGNTQEDIARTASELKTRFGNELRTLEPLYSLADFCYAVRREVIEAIGAADEGYGLGPCWEMDYNIRAARAGWHGVWACSSYVHRAPFTARRRFEEARGFAAARRRYQDKFCGARLRYEKFDYRDHCRGDACPNFAPAKLIKITEPFNAPSTQNSFAAASAQSNTPDVTCIMPTHNRRSFVPQAIRCFLKQNYQNAELLVIDDGSDSVEDCVPESDRIRYLRLPHKLTIGAKRNFACHHARGNLIVHWDDDDWYPPWRVSAQVEPLITGSHQLSGSSRVLYYDGGRDRAWEYRYAANNWVAGNTLAYRKELWAHNKFPDIQIGEDSRFVWSNSARGVYDLANPSLCVGMIHSANTSHKDINGHYWHEQTADIVRALLGDEIHFYRTAVWPADTTLPLLTCIMPTQNRRGFVPQALDSFARQDYPNRELVIVDDGQDPIEDLTQAFANVRYIRLPVRTSIGGKRNLAVHHARGEIIAHWDDDDWYSPDRLRYQAAPIIFGQADMTGLENAFILELPAGTFWTTNSDLHRKLFVGDVHGGTLVYRKDLLANGLRYPETNLAEDASLLDRARRSGKRLLRLSNSGVFVYVRHGRNAWKEFAPGRFLDPKGWSRITRPLNFPPATLEFYQRAMQH